MDYARIHKSWCDAMVAKAKKQQRVVTVKDTRKTAGIITSHMSKAMLAKELERITYGRY